MARVNVLKMERIEKERPTVQAEVASGYTSFEIDGEKYFQIDTYGSVDRKIKGKVSQMFQIDRDSAIALIGILKSEFNL